MEVQPHYIPNRLKMHRRLHRLKREHVSKLLGFHTTTQLSQWENGVSIPNGTQLLTLGIIYNTFPNELYFEYYQTLKEVVKARHSTSN